ncbi:GAF and ANTAR domain-containing protein [Nocardioides bizhenqiangii]|uniref:GAF and ANTAR domain-containing protein n=1 Tax=Nocardioides bizhenqiangii TaxID=3095076 RepID=A0ABZ0ZSQ5_9ACTN|nr:MULTISPECIES: GAF and ANTAR domain-containing protein [unclassified Nocardioides]MDZ5621964.1 GAF and ANTAR domain-containing protein [Nocardioides sp. HM23]WQQ27355.1 GAF and ANTAR domain-containing protein [Nocardioides sp. HM61]
MTTEQRLSQVFVELADTLVAEFDALDFLSTLTERSVELLHADAAGVILNDMRGSLHVVASTTDRAQVLELFELQNDEGPCLDCFNHGRAVVNVGLSDARIRWPRFSEAAAEVGYQSAHAIPLRLRDSVIGAMNLFSAAVVELTDEDVALGQALADIATIGLLQERAVRQSGLIAEQLQTALGSRILIEQAKGVLLASAGVGVDEAFRLMRDYSRRNHEPVKTVARRVIDRELTADDLR